MERSSIYKQFYKKLIIATSLFIFVLSFIFYALAKNSFYGNIQENLLSQAKKIEKNYISHSEFKTVKTQFQTIELVKDSINKEIMFNESFKNNNYFLEILYPIDLENNNFLKITKDISLERNLLYSIIFKNLLILAIPAFILMLLYYLLVSKSLLKPILQINKKLANMDENSLSKIDTKDLPIEFFTLAESINSLTNRIATYVKFKKELFIGVAHELKTPLAVMKLKNEVALKKKREQREYEEVLHLTVKQIDDMNIMISSILDIGRTEGAQFEQLQTIDLIHFIRKKTNDYNMLSNQKNIDLSFTSNVSILNISIRQTLFNQILQNFVQNAIKFTPRDKSIKIKLKKTQELIILTVTDEGIGIKEEFNEELVLFAPFKKVGAQNGVGLGLYLAKIASDALNGKVSIRNRKDGKKGCVAKLELNNTAI